MKFIIYWEECHDPFNWADETIKTYETDMEKVELNGIKNIMASLPKNSEWDYDNEEDGWIRCKCKDTFESNNIESAKKYVADNYYTTGDFIFTVYDGFTGKKLFTEEDI